MKKRNVAIMLLAMVLVAGCVTVTGPYYLEHKKYKEGIEALSDELTKNPNDASASYYMGRYYMGLNKPKKALPYLENAATLEPDKAEYIFWTGVAYWALLDFKAEKAAYEKVLDLEPNHISANLYLGHGYLDRGEWAKALQQYDIVIKLDKYNPEALYNRAFTLGELGKTKEEIAAWQKFLEFYPDGSLAMQATERLNLHGNFTYRNFILGQRNVTLRGVAFKPGTTNLDKESRPSLYVLSALMKNNKKLDVHIVVYVKGSAALAKKRARKIRDYMLNSNPEIESKRLPLSWFGIAEKIESGEKTFTLDESVQFITATR